MYFSKYNIMSQVKDSDNHFIVNLLSGNADILTSEESKLIQSYKGKELEVNDEISELIEKGYIVDKTAEKKAYQKAYLKFIDSRDDDEVQIFFVPNYACNFACSYCYQDEYTNQNQEVNSDVIDAFFDYIKTEFAGRKKYITVFGGEPLLITKKQNEIISYLITKANEAGLELSFVSNGYYLEEYIELLKTAKILEIQVTLDGTEQIHDKRRILKGGAGTFEKVVKGIDSCLNNGIMINLRMVADKENIDHLPELAQFAIDKGWTINPLFKTQIGRNYELHHCQSSPDKLFDRISLYAKLFELIKQYPYIQDFYKPGYSIAKFLSDNEKLPDALFDSCPACKTEWAFDYTGNIYSCTATVGKTDESLGTFFPEINRKEEIIAEWQSRDVTEISDCKECNLQLACGGGCGSVAKNNSGKICSTDCRPVKELLELGFAAYFENN